MVIENCSKHCRLFRFVCRRYLTIVRLIFSLQKCCLIFRYYYKSQILLPVIGRRLVYKFGPKATGWRWNPLFTLLLKMSRIKFGIPHIHKRFGITVSVNDPNLSGVWRRKPYRCLWEREDLQSVWKFLFSLSPWTNFPVCKEMLSVNCKIVAHLPV